MRVLVAVASRHGSTRAIANAIASELRAVGLAADVQDVGSLTSIVGYDAVVLGSAVYMGGWMPEAMRCVARLEHQLARVPVWLFSSGPLGTGDPRPPGEPQRISDLLHRTGAREHRLFVGKLDLADLSFRERLITRMLNPPAGDFRDWDAIHGWARAIAAALQPATPAAT